MSTTEPRFDPFLNDPTRWSTSLANVAEVMLPCLEAAGARSVVEVGAFAGDLTAAAGRLGGGNGATRGRRSTPSPQQAWCELDASATSWS